MDLDALLHEEGYGATAGAPGAPEENPDVGALLRAWANEKAAPELLEFQADVVRDLAATLDAQAKSLAEPDARRGPFVQGLYQLDVDRVKFIVAAYLRTRLGKVRRGSRGARCACREAASRAWARSHR